MAEEPLSGVRVLSLAINIPGPAAAARLRELGASITKIEPPGGDPLQAFSTPYYEQLAAGQDVVTIDLKSPTGQGELWERLGGTDVLLTSSRPSALARLGLDWPAVHDRLPALCQVAIVGYPADGAEVAGHDLTYQADTGTLQPPQLPTVLVADLGGAERAAAEAMAALLMRARSGAGCYREVALSDVARDFAQPVQHGLTEPDGILGGGFPPYGIYATATGFVAVAALEPHFERRLSDGLGVPATREALAAAFTARTADEWEAWGRENDLPIVAVRSPADRRH